MKKILVLFCAVFIVSRLFAVTGASSFLREGIGADAVAMGGAGTAGTRGVNSIYWNPAGLTRMGAYGWQAGSMYTAKSYDRYYGYAAIARHSEDYGDFGVSLITYGTNDIEIFDDTGQSTGSGSDCEFVGGISYANMVNYRFRYGVTMKGHYHDLLTYKATGYSMDAGVIFQPLLDREVYIGLMLQNILGQLFWNDYSEDMLSIYRIGAAVGIFEDIVRLSLDVVKEEALEDVIFRAGAEFRIMEYLFIRAGMDEEYPTAGAGIKYDAYKFDYAYTYDRQGLGDTHQFSLVLMW